jgi:hypothetical protein
MLKSVKENKNMKLTTYIKTAILGLAIFVANGAIADTMVWQGPTHTMTVGLNEDDISHIEFPEEISNITVENSDYIDILVVQGYSNRAFRMRSLKPKMATRMFLTGASGSTYIMVATTDVPYRSFVEVVDGRALENKRRNIAKQFGPSDFVRAMAEDAEIPGVIRETYVVPNWFQGSGFTFELSEVWQSPKLTGLTVHVQNDYKSVNEVNLPAISIPKTSEWGILRQASMENMRLEPKGKPNDKGVLFLIFER